MRLMWVRARGASVSRARERDRRGPEEGAKGVRQYTVLYLRVGRRNTAPSTFIYKNQDVAADRPPNTRR